jgi:hypothetical protein
VEENMGWWPFSKKNPSQGQIDSTVHIKGTRTWLIELQEICEKFYNNPVAAKIQIREMQIEWVDANKKDEVSNDLLDGLNRRSIRLLNSNDTEWLSLLDNIDFWKPGWRPNGDDED